MRREDGYRRREDEPTRPVRVPRLRGATPEPRTDPVDSTPLPLAPDEDEPPSR